MIEDGLRIACGCSGHAVGLAPRVGRGLVGQGLVSRGLVSRVGGARPVPLYPGDLLPTPRPALMAISADQGGRTASSQPGPATGVPAGRRARSPRSAVTTSGGSPAAVSACASTTSASSPLPSARTTRTPSGARARARPPLDHRDDAGAGATVHRPGRPRCGRATRPAGPAAAWRPPPGPATSRRARNRRRSPRPRAGSPPLQPGRSPDRANASSRLATGPCGKPAAPPFRCGMPAPRRPMMATDDRTPREADRDATVVAPAAPRSPHEGAHVTRGSGPRRRRRPAGPLRRHQVGRRLLRLAVGQRPGRHPHRAAVGRRRGARAWPRASTPPTRPPRRSRRWASVAASRSSSSCSWPTWPAATWPAAWPASTASARAWPSG